jgi:predicted ATPase/DNA-binding XRE family transcriptional regulator
VTSGGRLPFGKLLREFRIAKGLSQEALAERARISLDTVGALERGRRSAPHRDTLALIAEGLGLGPEERAQLEAAASASSRVGHPRVNQIESAARPPDAASEQPAPAHNIPYSVNSFFGRDRELGELKELIRSRRLVTVHGVVGVGKTRLVVELARALVNWAEFRDGIWFVDLGVVADPAAVVAGVAHALGVREVPNEPLLEAIVDTLRDERLLLVLDGCEHVLEPAALVAQRLTQSCPAVRIVATSSEALEIDGELVYHVEALQLPHAARGTEHPSLAELRTSAAVQLFLDRAHDADPHFFLAAAERYPEAVVEICERLDGLPLPLELAAARVRDLTLPEIRDALDSRFNLLARGKRTARQRHRTLRAMLDWSYGLLSEADQRIFRRLGVFTGSWTLDAALAVCGVEPEHTRHGVATLVSKSLATVVHGGGAERRYRLLESVREFARTLAAEQAHDADAARLHAEYYRDRAHAAAAAWRTEPADVARRAFEGLIADIADVRAALDWSVAERHDVVLGAELTSVLADVWAECGLDAEGLRRLNASRTALGLESGPPRLPSLSIREAALEPMAAAVEGDIASSRAAPAWLEAFTLERTYRAGEVIFSAGDDAHELLYIVCGTVALEEIGVELGAHELLGEIAFFSAKNRRTASAVCKTGVTVRAIGQEALVDLYESEPSFRSSLVSVFTQRLLQDLEIMRDREGGARP